MPHFILKSSMKMIMTSLFWGVLAAFIAVGAWYLLVARPFSSDFSLAGPSPTPTVAPLLKYSIDSLSARKPAGKNLRVDALEDEGEVVAVAEQEFIVRTFSFETDGRRVSGRLTAPSEPGAYPVIISIRGYVDREIYYPGLGTDRSANYLAQNGYITLAPDFLGYGTSDDSPIDGLEDRFATYTTVLDLIDLAPEIEASLDEVGVEGIIPDVDNIGIWAHSNGGQIALTALAATGGSYPTVLWAPVSKPFPYNILYYSDEAPDDGKALRKLVADFEDVYEADEYSFTNYLDQVNAPIQIHQGTADEAIPVPWSSLLVELLQETDVEVDYLTYPGENHNFNLGSWENVITATERFYSEHLVE